ncbi:hypothetical protein [Myxococcus sp. AB056]|uniref:hypothetical protein n=1 Tax=Myxococcus sp. AB056 TaxID=2562792 RepID=UPI001146FB1E|nr:hypothetical protein [Myxococcus sp. AB056]
MDRLADLWTQADSTFIGSLGLVAAVLLVLWQVISAPAGTVFFACLFGFSYFGHQAAGFVGTVGGLIVGAVVGLIAYVAVDELHDHISREVAGTPTKPPMPLWKILLGFLAMPFLFLYVSLRQAWPFREAWPLAAFFALDGLAILVLNAARRDGGRMYLILGLILGVAAFVVLFRWDTTPPHAPLAKVDADSHASESRPTGRP